MAGEGAPLSPRTMAGNMAMKQAREDLEEGRAEGCCPPDLLLTSQLSPCEIQLASMCCLAPMSLFSLLQSLILVCEFVDQMPK